jgi:hypothetical protein
MSSEPDVTRPEEKGPELRSDVPAPLPSELSQVLRPRRRWRLQRAVFLAAGLPLAYLATAYVIAPGIWSRYERRHPQLDDVPRITHTSSGIPGDPLNVGLIGTDVEVRKLMLAAGWCPADPLTFRSCVGMADAAVLKRPYESAPVSSLYLWGRQQDLAFEKAVGNNPRHRHHVRFWKSEDTDSDGRPVWIGAGTYDESVGFSHTTGQVTHHIAADVDAEREHLFTDLRGCGCLLDEYVIEGFHRVLQGRNGGGDHWRTDGHVYVGIIDPEAAR